MALPKRLRALLLVGLGMLVAVFGLLAWRANTRGAAARLVSDIRRAASARFPRRVQAAPVLSGSFGARAAEAWTLLGGLQARSSDVEFCRAIRGGEAPFETAPASCLRELAQGAAALEALLLATHAESAGPPAGLGLLDMPEPQAAPRGWGTAGYAARMAGLRVRSELAAGTPEKALHSCVDVLALARDVSFGTGLPGRLSALTVSEVAFGPCAAALDAAPAEAKRAAALELARIADGTAPLADSLSEASVAVRARLFAPYLGMALGTLPEAVQGWARAAEPAAGAGPFEAVAVGAQWHALDRWLEAVVEAARLPPPAAAERLGALSAAAETRFPALGFPDLGLLAQSDARVRAQLSLLRRAAEVGALRAETGAWPALQTLSVPLRATDGQSLRLQERDGGSEALLSDTSAPRGALEVLLHADR